MGDWLVNQTSHFADATSRLIRVAGERRGADLRPKRERTVSGKGQQLPRPTLSLPRTQDLLLHPSLGSVNSVRLRHLELTL